MKSILKSHQFQSKNHDFLQQLWLSAHYEEWEKLNGKKISSATRVRVRKRNPFPMTIWDGDKKRYTFKVSDKIT